MLITPAYAQDITGMFGSATQFLPLVLIFVVFYFLLIRPQQQKQKEMRRMLAALKRGDRVVTGGGIIGTVQRVPMVADKDPFSSARGRHEEIRDRRLAGFVDDPHVE